MSHGTFRELYPGPWQVEETPSGFKVVDGHGVALVYVYAADPRGWRVPAGGEQKLSREEAKTLAVAIAALNGGR